MRTKIKDGSLTIIKKNIVKKSLGKHKSDNIIDAYSFLKDKIALPKLYEIKRKNKTTTLIFERIHEPIKNKLARIFRTKKFIEKSAITLAKMHKKTNEIELASYSYDATLKDLIENNERHILKQLKTKNKVKLNGKTIKLQNVKITYKNLFRLLSTTSYGKYDQEIHRLLAKNKHLFYESQPYFTHGDFTLANLIYANRIYVLDLETARSRDFYFDLASAFDSICLRNKRLFEEFLSYYLKERRFAFNKKRLYLNLMMFYSARKNGKNYNWAKKMFIASKKQRQK